MTCMVDNYMLEKRSYESDYEDEDAASKEEEYDEWIDFQIDMMRGK